MARSSAQPQGRSSVVTVAIVVVAIIGVVAWRYMPGSMRSGTFLKVAPQILADNGGESDEELEGRLRDLAIRSGLSMGEGAVEIRRPRAGVVEARLRFSFPVDLFVFRTRSEYDKVVSATVRARDVVREARVSAPAPEKPAAEPAATPDPAPEPAPAEGPGAKTPPASNQD